MNTIEPNFDLNLLRLVVALDDTRSVSRAAELLGMSQSGFSTALARLRRCFNEPLFVRTAQGMEPTVRAASIAQAARDVLERVHTQVLVQPPFEPASSTCEFRLVMADVAEIVFLPRLLQHLGQVAPGVTVHSEMLPRDALRDALESGRADLALGYFPDLSGAGFYQQTLYRHTYACMLRPGHPALRGKLTLQVYADLHHAVVWAPARSDELFDEHLGRQGLQRRIGLRTPHHLSLPMIVESTDLIATVPIAAADRFARHGLIAMAPLPFAPPVFDVQQNWHARSHAEPRMRWLRSQVALLFNDTTDPWRALEAELYGRLREGITNGRPRPLARKSPD